MYLVSRSFFKRFVSCKYLMNLRKLKFQSLSLKCEAVTFIFIKKILSADYFLSNFLTAQKLMFQNLVIQIFTKRTDSADKK